MSNERPGSGEDEPLGETGPELVVLSAALAKVIEALGSGLAIGAIDGNGALV